MLASPRCCRADEIAAVGSDPQVGLGEPVEGPKDAGARASVIDDDQLGEDMAVPEPNPSCTANVGDRLLQTGGRETTLELIASRKRDRDAHQHAVVRCHHQPSSLERPSASSVHAELIQAREVTGVGVLGTRERFAPLATCRALFSRGAGKACEHVTRPGSRLDTPRRRVVRFRAVRSGLALRSAASVTASQGRPR